MDENLSETEKLIMFRSAKVVFIALASYFLLRNFPHSDLPVLQLSLVMGVLSAFRYFNSIISVVSQRFSEERELLTLKFWILIGVGWCK